MNIINGPTVIPTDLPTGWLAQTYERRQSLSLVALTSGRLHVSAIWLPSGMQVSNIMFQTSTTALATPSHGWAALYTPARALLGQSTNDTSIAWAANTVKTFALAAPATTTVSGWHYIGVSVVAGTMPTLVCVRPDSAGLTSTIPPIIGGFSTASGLTSTAPDPAAAITSGFIPYGGVS
jgi:hypothetical protein